MRVNPSDLLQQLGVKVVSTSGHNLIIHCPFHGVDRHPSARMHAQTGQWICSSCHLKGGAVSFVARMCNLTYADAKTALENRYGVEVVAAGGLEQAVRRNLATDVEPLPERVRPSEDWIECYTHSWGASAGGLRALDYMEDRGFPRQLLDLWQIGYDAYSNRIAIPVRDADGVLVGFKGRAVELDQEPRYLIIGGRAYGFDTYSKSQYVYGLNFVPYGSRVVVCYSDDTEALTPSGWKLISDISTSDFVLQYDLDGCGSFVNPSAVQSFWYDGEMVNIYANWCDLLVTPEHRMLARYQSSSYVEKTADRVRLGSIFPTGAAIPNGLLINEVEARLVAAWAADGCRVTRAPNRRCWNLKKERKKKRLRWLLKEVGASYREVPQKGKNVGWTMFWVEADSVEFLDLLCPEKMIDLTMLCWSLESRRYLLGELGFWDGDFTGVVGIRFFTSRRREAEAVSAIAAATGWGCTLRVDSRTSRPEQLDQYVLNLSPKSERAISKTPMKSLYRGVVYCCTVPSGWLVVRRNGKHMVAGNCEGELNVVATSWKTKHLAVGVAGSEFSETQRALIVERCSEAIIFFDDDMAGRRGAAKVACELQPYMPVRVVMEAPGDAAELSGEQIDELVGCADPALLLEAQNLLTV